MDYFAVDFALTQKVVCNILQAQPNYLSDLNDAVPVACNGLLVFFSVSCLSRLDTPSCPRVYLCRQVSVSLDRFACVSVIFIHTQLCAMFLDSRRRADGFRLAAMQEASGRLIATALHGGNAASISADTIRDTCLYLSDCALTLLGKFRVCFPRPQACSLALSES